MKTGSVFDQPCSDSPGANSGDPSANSGDPSANSANSALQTSCILQLRKHVTHVKHK